MNYTTINGGGLWGGRLLRFEQLVSTNVWALENLAECEHGDVVWARSQTGGHGREGRSWLAPGDRGLTISAVVRDVPFPAVVPNFSQAAAVALYHLLQLYDVEAEFKWPNDVMVGGRKIAGILPQCDGERGAVVIGIGLNINVTKEDFRDARLDQPATSILVERASPGMEGWAYPVEVAVAQLVERLAREIDELHQEGPAPLVDTWHRHDFLLGKRVCIHTPEGERSGAYRGLDSQARLCLQDDAGTEAAFWSGEIVRIVPL